MCRTQKGLWHPLKDGIYNRNPVNLWNCLGLDMLGMEQGSTLGVLGSFLGQETPLSAETWRCECPQAVPKTPSHPLPAGAHLSLLKYLPRVVVAACSLAGDLLCPHTATPSPLGCPLPSRGHQSSAPLNPWPGVAQWGSNIWKHPPNLTLDAVELKPDSVLPLVPSPRQLFHFILSAVHLVLQLPKGLDVP